MKTKEACAITYGPYIVALGPSGCNVSRNQKHIGQVIGGRLELVETAGPILIETARDLERLAFALRNLLELVPKSAAI